jgi:AcrR family transcriptional regulator
MTPPDLAGRPARERILLTAHDLFYRDGIRVTGIDRVIAEAGVTKVTFYRHFPSKDDLVLAFLAHRHDLWMGWFTEALARHAPRRGAAVGALVPALREWLASDGYRGCAFINATGELGPQLPEAVAASRRHKADMTEAIALLLPASRSRQADAEALALAVDGAIVRAQMAGEAEPALRALARLVQALVRTIPDAR